MARIGWGWIIAGIITAMGALLVKQTRMFLFANPMLMFFIVGGIIITAGITVVTGQPKRIPYYLLITCAVLIGIIAFIPAIAQALGKAVIHFISIFFVEGTEFMSQIAPIWFGIEGYSTIGRSITLVLVAIGVLFAYLFWSSKQEYNPALRTITFLVVAICGVFALMLLEPAVEMASILVKGPGITAFFVVIFIAFAAFIVWVFRK